MNRTELCSLLGIQYPIICGAMTGISGPALTAAVSEAGGLGVYATGMHSNDIGPVREEIQECKHLTAKPFGVNVAIVAPIADELMVYLCKEGIAAVTTGAGSPAKYIPMLKEAGVKLIPVIGAPKHALKMEAAGADAVIAEGMESGGNAGNMTTLPLMTAVKQRVQLPVIAAGGIAGGRGMAAAFALGACGVQMGTRFMLSKEAGLCAAAQEFLLARDGSETLVPGQKIGNRVNARVVMCPGVEKILAAESLPGMTVDEYRRQIGGSKVTRALYEGDLENGYISAGMAIGSIDRVLSCREIIEQTMEEFNAVCADMTQC